MRHILITGTSSGIGVAIAQRLLLSEVQITGLDAAPPVIKHKHFTPVNVDLTDALARDVATRDLSGVDAIVHAAGVMRGGRLGELDLASSDLLWKLHVDAAIALADKFVPHMKSGGRIVMLGSRAAKGVAGKSQYAASKAALVGLARSWAKELASRGITVNVVAPAATDTAMLIDKNRSAILPEVPPIGRLICLDIWCS